jgi:hypothetical protein
MAYLNQSFVVGMLVEVRGDGRRCGTSKGKRTKEIEYLRVAERFPGVELCHRQDFTARLHGGVEQITVIAIKWTENLPNFLHLYRTQTVRFAVCICAEQRFGMEVTQVRILDDTVHNTVDSITLLQDFIMDQ